MTTTDKSSNPSTNTAAATAGIEDGPPAIATGHEGTLKDQFNGYISRVRSGEMGMLPALAGLIVLSALFGFLSPFFFTRINMANLLTQTAALMMLAIALTFVILIAEIDLSAGVTAGVGMAVFILLVDRGGWNWVAAFVFALIIGAAIGLFIGFAVARVGIPSFVVTLGLFLGFQGLQLVLLGDGGSFRVQEPAVVAIMNSSMPDWAGWVLLVVIILISAGTGLYDRQHRIATGMPVRPLSLLGIRLLAWVVGGGIAVAMLSQNRSAGAIPISGVPIVVPIALAIVWIGTLMLDRTRFG
ncbi:MAG: D-xylose transport system permease protein, partial [Microbacteriaceae bacterium]|nr:D-xylose transport system permease protein [Microbacteriaceae bacterium]